MKILVYGGGLGNQIFGYAFTLFMKDLHPKQKIYGVYSRARLYEHNGMELDKWFDVDLPPSRWYITFLTYGLYLIKKLTGWTGLLDLNQVIMQKEDALVYFAQHSDKRYIPEGDWLRFKIKEDVLGKRNLDLINAIRNNNSVFIHIRRGDYLSPKYKERFEGCCSLDYYERSIVYIKKKVDNPRFFIFSDDLQWVMDNLRVDNPTFIDWNTGENSPLDMYLMSECKYAIIANSTFSYWGAMLGPQKEIVIYPAKWINHPFMIGDIFPKDWIKF